MPRLTGISFAHPRVDAAARAAVATPAGGVEAMRRRLAGAGHDVLFLVTCLRVEVAWLGGPDTVGEVGDLVYGPEAAEGGELRHDAAAFQHLARVAAGLDSPLVGEPEVLGQFRQATKPLKGSDIGRVLEAAVGVARSSRRLLAEVPRGSLAIAAADTVAGADRVAVLGGGAMAKAVLSRLADAGADVIVYARRPDRVGEHDPRPWADLDAALESFPAVVSTIPGKSPVRTQVELKSIAAQRTEPLLLVDLGMPPALAAADTDGVDYLGVDALAASVSWPRADEADARIAEESVAAWRRLSAPDRAGQVIAAVRSQAEAAVAEEVKRLAPRLEGSEDVLRQVAHRVANRLLHPPISYLAGTDEDSIEVLAEAFGVEP